jgi:hypothetical protein
MSSGQSEILAEHEIANIRRRVLRAVLPQCDNRFFGRVLAFRWLGPHAWRAIIR